MIHPVTGLKRAFLASCLSLILVGAVSAAPAQAAQKYKPNEVLVKYKDGVRRDRMSMQKVYGNAQVVRVKRFGGVFRQFEQLFTKPGTNIKDVIASLEKDPSVEYAQPNYIVYAIENYTSRSAARLGSRKPTDQRFPCIPGMDIPNCTPWMCFVFPDMQGCDGGGGDKPKDPPKDPDQPTPPPGRPPVADKPEDPGLDQGDPDLNKAYGISKIGAPEAWKVTHGSQDIVVAVIDTGIDYNHEDLAYNVWRNPNPDKGDLVGWDFVHNDNLPFDDHGHGTHCSGTIGAVGGDGKGLSGVNQRVSIMGLKFLSAEGSGDLASAISAIDYGIQHGAKVMSNSWGSKGGADDNKALLDAINRAEQAGVLFIAAAGNDSTDNDTDFDIPASFNAPNMISVAATDDKDGMAYFSNYGAKSVHLGAPGVNVYSLAPGNKYATMSGTSMACPHVAGAAALVWSSNPSMTYKDVKERLLAGVDKIPSLAGKTITGGRLNVAHALGL